MITFFDIPSAMSDKTWSINTWKTRLSLNFKGLAYKTEWVEYCDIASVLQKHKIGPTTTKRDGSPHYTLPAILDVDDATGAVKGAIAESFKIAEYLDKAYPDTPRLLPEDPAKVEELRAFGGGFLLTILPSLPLLLKAVLPQLNKASQDHFTHARASDLFDMYHTKTLEEIQISPENKAELWEGTKGSLDALNSKLGEGHWYFGEKISFADLVVGGYLVWAKTVFGSDSSEWSDIKSWNGGRWERHLEGLSEFTAKKD